MEQRQGLLGRTVHGLKVTEHGDHDQKRIGGLPGFRGGLKHLVLEGFIVEPLQTFVCPACVGVQDLLLLGLYLGVDLLGHRSESMLAKPFVGSNGRFPYQFGKPTRRDTSEQVHLKESVLSMCKTKRVGRIQTGFRMDRRYSLSVAVNLDRLLDMRGGLPSVEVRQAGSDFPGSKGAGAEDQQAACDGGLFGCLAKPFGPELLGGYRLEVDRIG